MKTTEVYVPIEVEHLLSVLFGKKHFHGHCGHLSLSTWKNDVLRINHAIRRAVELNLEGDDEHRDKIAEQCGHLSDNLKTAKSADQANGIAIKHLTTLIFMLLGDMPNNWERRGTSHPDTWKLDRHRKVVYVRTTEQKANRIMELASDPEFKHLEFSKTELWLKRRGKFRNNAGAFVKWFRENFSDVYNSWIK